MGKRGAFKSSRDQWNTEESTSGLEDKMQLTYCPERKVSHTEAEAAP